MKDGYWDKMTEEEWKKSSEYCLNFQTSRHCKFSEYNQCRDPRNPTTKCVFYEDES